MNDTLPLQELASNGYLSDLIATRANNNKIPSWPDWPNHMTTDSDLLRWEEGEGIGIICRNLIAVDIDIEKDVALSSGVHKIAKRLLGVSPCRIGKHPKRLLPYRLKGDPISKKILSFNFEGHTEKIEILAKGQQFICYGQHPDTQKPYTWIDGNLSETPISDLPEVTEGQLKDFLKECEVYLESQGYASSVSAQGKAKKDRLPIGHPDHKADNIQDVCDALKVIPNTYSYDEWIRMSAAFKAAVGGDDDLYHIYEDWSLQWLDNTPEKIRKVWDSIYDTEAGAGTIFYEAKKHGWITTDDPEWLQRMNQEYFVSTEGGQAYVFKMTDDPSLEGRRLLKRLTPIAFRSLFDNKKIQLSPSDEKKVGLGTSWFNHERRREYIEGMAFCPNADPPEGYYNLWQGYGVEPVEGSWERMRSHIKNMLCNGNQEYYDYLIGWMANAVQNPNKQGEVAVVLQGGKGVGKGTFGHYFGKLFGHHYLYLSSSGHLVGNFNSHLRDAVFVFLDEAFFAGDKKNESVLKSIITDPLLTIEKKGVDAVQCPNYTHILMASNDDWVVPASDDERRFFVLEIDGERKGDCQYYEALHREMNGDGPAAMLNYILAYDLSNFDVRDIPQTTALINQKLKSLPAVQQWLYDCLYEARIGGYEWGEEGLIIPTNAAHKQYEGHHKEHSWSGKPLPASDWSKSLRKILTYKGQPLITDGGKLQDQFGQRRYNISFPALQLARKAFEDLIGGEVEWP